MHACRSTLEDPTFGAAFRLDVRDEGADFDADVPAGAVQLLVENAVKHNAFHSAAPLVVDVVLKRDAVVVTNARRAREDGANSTGVGLKNLAERVRLASGRALVIDAGAERFTVTLPLSTPAAAAAEAA